jgi:hypothetical protein
MTEGTTTTREEPTDLDNCPLGRAAKSAHHVLGRQRKSHNMVLADLRDTGQPLAGVDLLQLAQF